MTSSFIHFYNHSQDQYSLCTTLQFSARKGVNKREVDPHLNFPQHNPHLRPSLLPLGGVLPSLCINGSDAQSSFSSRHICLWAWFVLKIWPHSTTGLCLSQTASLNLLPAIASSQLRHKVSSTCLPTSFGHLCPCNRLWVGTCPTLTYPCQRQCVTMLTILGKVC